MDEEDIREREEARQLVTSNTEAGFGTQDDGNVRHVLEDIFRPVEHSVGEKLLMRMGWRKGEGIRAAKDIDLVACTRKEDTKGLGLDDQAVAQQPLMAVNRTDPDNHENDDGRPGLSFARLPRQPKVVRKVGGIGLGVATSSDEEDVYSIGPSISRRKNLGMQKEKSRKDNIISVNPAVKDKPVLKTKTRLPTFLTSMRQCHDGKAPLGGFLLADELQNFSNIPLTSEKYAPPEVPNDWAPAGLDGAVVADCTDSVSTTMTQIVHDHPPQSQTTSQSERMMSTKSIFDFLSPAARDKLAAVTGRTDLPPAGDKKPSSHQVDLDNTELPQLDSTTALAALSYLQKSNSKPYSDSAKQLRYKAFLQSASTNTNSTADSATRPKSSSQNNNRTELHEFARAAQVFRPSTASTFLSSRFTSATHAPADSIAQTIQDANSPNTAQLLTQPHTRTKPADPAEEAARIGMFGPATRSIQSWTPTRLLCKRFGVDMPVPVD